MDSSTSSGDNEDGGNDGEEAVVMNLMIAIMGNTGAERGTYGAGGSQQGGADMS